MLESLCHYYLLVDSYVGTSREFATLIASSNIQKMNRIKSIKALLQRGDLKKALHETRDLVESLGLGKFISSLTAIESRWSQLSGDRTRNVIQEEDYRVEFARITRDLIEYIDSLDYPEDYEVDDLASYHLLSLKRVRNSYEALNSLSGAKKLLFPFDKRLFVTINGHIVSKDHDLFQLSELVPLVEIESGATFGYKDTGVLTTRYYRKQLPEKPIMVSVQAVAVCQVDSLGRDRILDLIASSREESYNMWVGKSNPHDTIKPQDFLLVMNRRIGGWSGSPENPKIELLLAGGAMPSVWMKDRRAFEPMDPKAVIIKEFEEELKYTIGEQSIELIGSFINNSTKELVILGLVFLTSEELARLQKGALSNYQENIDGIFLGAFDEVMQLYLEDGTDFAGGQETVHTNFPSQPELMAKIRDRLRGMTGGSSLSEAVNLPPHLAQSLALIKKFSFSFLRTINGAIDWSEYQLSIDDSALILLGDDISKWNNKELYVFLSAMYLHRIGLVGNVLESPEKTFENYQVRSKEIIIQNREKLRIPKQSIEDIILVVVNHGKSQSSTQSPFAEQMKEMIQGGQKTRELLALYLGLLSRLAMLDVTTPGLDYDQIYFPDRSSKLYREVLPSRVFNKVKLKEWKQWGVIGLEISPFEAKQLRSNLLEVSRILNQLKIDIRKVKRLPSFNSKTLDIEIDKASFQNAINQYCRDGFLLEEVEQGLKYGAKALLTSIFPATSDSKLVGWGREFKILHEYGNDFDHEQGARVVNTCEVLMALSNPTIWEGQKSLEREIEKIVQDVISNLKYGRISKVDPGRPAQIQSVIDALAEEKDQTTDDRRLSQLRMEIKRLEKMLKVEGKYNPLTSITNMTPSVRVNSTAILAFSYVLERDSGIDLVAESRKEILGMLGDCVQWLFEAPDSPISHWNGLDLHSSESFRLLIALKALVRIEKFRGEMEVPDSNWSKLDTILGKVINEFLEVADFPDLVYRALILEILVYYLQNRETVSFRSQINLISVKALIGDLADSFFAKLNPADLKVWPETNDVLMEPALDLLHNNQRRARRVKLWTHISSVWIVEGLCHCLMSGVLGEKHGNLLLQIIPLLLVRQQDDGFFDSESKISSSQFKGVSTKYIFKTALFVHVLSQLQKVLKKMYSNEN